MGVVVDPSVFAASEPDGCSNEYVMVVSGSDAELVSAALGRAGRRFLSVDEDGSEGGSGDDRYTPNYVSEVAEGRTGPWLYVDCKAEISPLMRSRFLRILVEELERAGVRDAEVRTPTEDDMYGGPLRNMALVPRAVVLCLYPPSPPVPTPGRPRPQNDQRGQVTVSWIDTACEWLAGAGSDEDPVAMVKPKGGRASWWWPLASGVSRLRRDRAGLVVTGDLEKNLRGVHVSMSPSGQGSLALAAGGPSATDDVLLNELAMLIGLARRLAGGAAYAFASIDVNFMRCLDTSHRPDFANEGGEDPVADPWMELLLDEIVLDGFPYQILGPGHVQRLGGEPLGARHLDNGRVELEVGAPRDWLLAPAAFLRRDFSRWVPPARYMRNPGIQREARRILANCLLRSGEAQALRLARRSQEPSP